MTEFERKLILAIRESADPAEAMEIVIDILQRVIAGEDVQSIAASYRIKLETVFMHKASERDCSSSIVSSR